LEAGAHTVTTSSFGGSRLKLRQYGLEDSASKINCQLATIAADAAGSHALVLGDIGPTGQFVEPLGDVTEDEMREAFSEQITALVEGGAQAVLIETMMDLTEAGLAVEAAYGVDPQMPVIVTLTLNRSPDGFRTMMGMSPQQALEKLSPMGIDVIGANCGSVDLDDIVEVIDAFTQHTLLPVLVQPNAGLPELLDGETVFNRTADEFGEAVKRYTSAGASLIGGCCGTMPEHIAAAAAVLAKL
jgi:5-methyltetrahydrofolate--homocysteine methyltransferase